MHEKTMRNRKERKIEETTQKSRRITGREEKRAMNNMRKKEEKDRNLKMREKSDSMIKIKGWKGICKDNKIKNARRLRNIGKIDMRRQT